MANLQVGVAGNGTVTVGAGASVHSPASNTLTLGSNNAERFRITGVGSVGIGTDDPVLKLHLHTSDSGNNYLKFTNATTGTLETDGVHLGLGSDEAFNINQRESNDIRLFTAATERLRIDSSGRLLLGTTTEGNDNGDELTISKDSGAMGMTLRSGDSSNCHLYFSDATSGTGEYAGYMAYQHSDNSLQFGTNSSERMRLDSSGRLLLGTTSGSHTLTVSGDIATSGDVILTVDDEKVQLGASQDFLLFHNGSNNYVYGVNNHPTLFHTNNIERMRLTGDGEWMVATTSSSPDTASNVSGMTYASSKLRVARNGDACGAFNRNSTTGDIIQLNYNGTQRGSIQTDGTVIAFNTGSDYRLKENEVALTDGITKVKQLKPYTFNFKDSPNKIDQGFFAHEVQPVVPGAVSGTKDAVHSEDKDSEGIKAGDIDAQQMDYAKLTPLLTAALQEAIAEIETLKVKVAALESS